MALFCTGAMTGRAPSSAHQHAGLDADQVAAPAAVDVDAGSVEHAGLDVHRHRLARAERRGAADLVAAVALRHLGRARLDLLAADLARQVLRAHLPVAVHQHHQRPRALVLHHQRLDHLVLGHAELARRLGRAAVLDVVVDVFGEGDAVPAQPLRSRGLADVFDFPAHGVRRPLRPTL